MKNHIRLILTTISMIIYNLSIIVFSWCFKLITDSLVNKEYALFKTYILLAVFVVLIQSVDHYAYIRGKSRYIKEKLIELKSKFIRSVFDYDISDFMSREKSEYRSFLFHDMNIYEQKILTGKFELAEKLVLMFISTIAIMLINVRFVILVVFLSLFSVLIPGLFGSFAKRYSNLMVRTNCSAMDKFDEMLDGFVILRTFSSEARGIRECNEALQDSENAKMKYTFLMGVFQSILILVTTFFTLIIFIWGGQSVIEEQISVGELIALIQMLFNVAGPVMGVMTALGNIKAAKPVAEKYKTYLSIHRNDGEKEFSLDKQIVVDHLSFGYQDSDKPALDDICCEFKKGKKYAIVGENGSGKSTLLKVLAGVNDIHGYRGKIMIDDVERREIRDSGFWNNVSYIPQQVFLFNNGLIDNICMNRNNMSVDSFMDLAKALDAEKLIENDHENKGNELSGGERQRIAFMREMLKGTPIIMADEPDSALDVDAGERIRDIILNCNKTCIVVTHRIGACLAGFDQILVMAGGKIVETGTYDFLMAKKGYFYDMCGIGSE